jgi:PEP-CTERM motif
MKTALLMAFIASTAGAQTYITSGSMAFTDQSQEAAFSFSGNGFNVSGNWGFGYYVNPLTFPLLPGGYSFQMSNGNSETLSMGGQGDSSMAFYGGADITGPGSYTVPFSMDGTINAPTPECPNCNAVHFQGDGMAALQVINDPYVSGALLVTSESFTVDPKTQDIPEPGTLGLLVLGLMGLGSRFKYRGNS